MRIATVVGVLLASTAFAQEEPASSWHDEWTVEKPPHEQQAAEIGHVYVDVSAQNGKPCGKVGDEQAIKQASDLYERDR